MSVVVELLTESPPNNIRICIIRVVRTKEPFFPLEIVHPSKNRSYFNGTPIVKWNVNKQVFLGKLYESPTVCHRIF